jgi:hypothetical protein
MKHLLNEMSEEEKSFIRGQHTGGKVFDTTKFRKLLEYKLGNVKPLISEQGTETYPSTDNETTSTNDIPECNSKMEARNEPIPGGGGEENPRPGGDSFINLAGKSVEIRTNDTINPTMRRYTVYTDGKPFCYMPR